MQNYLLKALNIRSHEAAQVSVLLKIKFILGLATSFLVAGSMTLFLTTNSPNQLPSVYLLIALLLLPINFIYNYLDHHYKPIKVLLIVTAFCSVSTAALFATQTVLEMSFLAFVFTAWNLVLYMLVGYAFWGLSSTMFNVRESRRVFAIIGAGDIPSKLLGYLLSSFIIPVIGALNFLGISVILFAFCYAFFIYIQHKIPHSEIHEHHTVLEEKNKNFLLDIFGNKLILFISLLSFIAYLVHLFIDYTFLIEIKERFTTEKELATFISLFFAGGRILAFVFKMIFSSRVISSLGLHKSLILTPSITFFICLYILALNVVGDNEHMFLYVFGLMAIVSEILRSVIQEPVFFILFQPLSIHTRLKGHLVAKGYIFPIALLISGVFLKLILKDDNHLSIPFIVAVIVVYLILWMLVIPLIKREYFAAVSRSIQSGFFTGQSMFLEDGDAQSILLNKVITGKPLEIIHALDLLQRSGFAGYNAILAEKLKYNADPQLMEYILDNVSKGKITELLIPLQEALPTVKTEKLRQQTLHTILALKPSEVQHYQYLLNEPTDGCTAEVLISMIKNGGKTSEEALAILQKRVEFYTVQDRLLVTNVLEKEMVPPHGLVLLKKLFVDKDENIVLKAAGVAGKQKQFGMVDTILKAYLKYPHHKNAFIQAISFYGDEFFKDSVHVHMTKYPELVHFFIDIATKTEGPNTLDFLLNVLNNQGVDNGKLIHILYDKKYVPTSDKISLFDALLDKCMQDITRKFTLLSDWTAAQGDIQVQSAIHEEVKYQFVECIELCGILYGHQNTNRILQIFDMENDHQLSNALELMELIMPKKHFMSLETIWEGLLHFKKNTTQTSVITPAQKMILTDIMTHGQAFKSWTRAIVMFLLSKFPDVAAADILDNSTAPVVQPIEVETRNYLIQKLGR